MLPLPWGASAMGKGLNHASVAVNVSSRKPVMKQLRRLGRRIEQDIATKCIHKMGTYVRARPKVAPYVWKMMEVGIFDRMVGLEALGVVRMPRV